MIELLLAVYCAGVIVSGIANRKVGRIISAYGLKKGRLTPEAARQFHIGYMISLPFLSMAWPVSLVKSGWRGLVIPATEEQIHAIVDARVGSD